MIERNLMSLQNLHANPLRIGPPPNAQPEGFDHAADVAAYIRPRFEGKRHRTGAGGRPPAPVERKVRPGH